MAPSDIIRAAMTEMEALRIPVVWIEGWESRGRPRPFHPKGLVCHHTATTWYDYDYPSLRLIRDGREDLSGPLAHFGLGRHTGTVYVIAAGNANHAGPGGWRGLAENSSVWGIEAENDGVGEEWSRPIMRSYLALAAALARNTAFDSSMICGHREWTSEKPDPKGIDMDGFRHSVQSVLDGGTDVWRGLFVPVLAS